MVMSWPHPLSLAIWWPIMRWIYPLGQLLGEDYYSLRLRGKEYTAVRWEETNRLGKVTKDVIIQVEHLETSTEALCKKQSINEGWWRADSDNCRKYFNDLNNEMKEDMKKRRKNTHFRIIRKLNLLVSSVIVIIASFYFGLSILPA